MDSRFGTLDREVVKMKILCELDTIHNLPHVRLCIDIDHTLITIVATEEDRESKQQTIIGLAQFEAKKII